MAGADIIYTWSLRSPHIKSPRARAPDPQPPSLLVPASSKAQPVPPISPPTRPVPLSLPLPTQKSLPRAPAEPTIPPRLRSLSPRSLSICSARKGSCPTPSKNSSIRSRSSCDFLHVGAGERLFPTTSTGSYAPCRTLFAGFFTFCPIIGDFHIRLGLTHRAAPARLFSPRPALTPVIPRRSCPGPVPSLTSRGLVFTPGRSSVRRTGTCVTLWDLRHSLQAPCGGDGSS